VIRRTRSSGISEIAVEGVAALDPEKRRVPAVGHRSAVLGGVAHDPEVLGDALEDGLEASQVLEEDLRARGGAAPGIRRDDPGGARHRRLAHARKVDLAVDASAEETVAVPLAQVVPEQTRPDEAVEVEVEHVARQVEVHGLSRDAECPRPAVGVGTAIDGGQRRHRTTLTRDPGSGSPSG
jgi:hypothetical protein